MNAGNMQSKVNQLAQLYFDQLTLQDLSIILNDAFTYATGTQWDKSFGLKDARKFILPLDTYSSMKRQLVTPFEISESIQERFQTQPTKEDNLEELKVNNFQDSEIIKKKWLPASKKTHSPNPQLQTLSSTYFIERRKNVVANAGGIHRWRLLFDYIYT